MEKLNYEDGYLVEVLIDKINELIDYVQELDSHLTSRIDNHWAYHRRKAKEERRDNGEGH